MKIINNFLPKFSFDFLNEKLLDKHFPWYHQNSKVLDDDNEEQFTHLFYSDETQYSNKAGLLKPIFDKLNVKILIRAKINLTLKEDIIRPFKYHMDYPQCNTAIFYLNTNNGKTIFKDGQEVESVANRMVIFPSKLEHAGTTHTDKKYRIVLNINYLNKGKNNGNNNN
tara:strand:- start:139 stop:642 length:504 start_codon:yes stop_codon:yes gene_type:complete